MSKGSTLDPIKIISASTLVPIEGEILSPGGMVIQGSKILDMGTPADLKNRYPNASVEHFESKTLLPGLINAHTDLSLSYYPKASSSAMQSEDGRLSLMRYFIEVSRFKSQMPIHHQQSAVNKGLELCLGSGVTTLADVCRYPAALPCYEKSNLRVVVLAEIENIQRALAQEEFEQALALVDELEHLGSQKISAGIAPLSAYTLSKHLLRVVASHATQMQIPLHLKAALSFSEMEFFFDSQGEVAEILFEEAGWKEKIPPPHRMTPVQYLYEIGLLKPNVSLLGCLHLGPTDAALLARSEAMRIFAPLSFQYLQAGEVSWKKVLANQVPWALGSLGFAAGSSLDLWEEMREILYQTEDLDRTEVARAVLHAATLGGARALLLQDKVGSFVVGKEADCIVLDTPEGDCSLLAALIDQTKKTNLVAVFVAGECVYRR